VVSFSTGAKNGQRSGMMFNIAQKNVDEIRDDHLRDSRLIQNKDRFLMTINGYIFSNLIGE
jgi:hypothetical protein